MDWGNLAIVLVIGLGFIAMAFVAVSQITKLDLPLFIAYGIVGAIMAFSLYMLGWLFVDALLALLVT